MKAKTKPQKEIPYAILILKIDGINFIAEQITRTDFGCEFVIQLPRKDMAPKLKGKLPKELPPMFFHGFKQKDLRLIDVDVVTDSGTNCSKARLKYAPIFRGGKRKGAGRPALGKVFFAKRVHPEHVALIEAFILGLPEPLPGDGVK